MFGETSVTFASMSLLAERQERVTRSRQRRRPSNRRSAKTALPTAVRVKPSTWSIPTLRKPAERDRAG